MAKRQEKRAEDPQEKRQEGVSLPEQIELLIADYEQKNGTNGLAEFAKAAREVVIREDVTDTINKYEAEYLKLYADLPERMEPFEAVTGGIVLMRIILETRGQIVMDVPNVQLLKKMLEFPTLMEFSFTYNYNGEPLKWDLTWGTPRTGKRKKLLLEMQNTICAMAKYAKEIESDTYGDWRDALMMLNDSMFQGHENMFARGFTEAETDGLLKKISDNLKKLKADKMIFDYVKGGAAE